ncbi:hypothetical protein OG21DRAFT_1483586 [Imleria badia]|nr:hypothetical protein OG21DRAFT_1483586 [Imleria badia]
MKQKEYRLTESLALAADTEGAFRVLMYEGYYIPKGVIVLANNWAMSRDGARYPDPDKFNPERFLNAEGMLTDDDPAEFVFGFGR